MGPKAGKRDRVGHEDGAKEGQLERLRELEEQRWFQRIEGAESRQKWS